MTRVKLNLSIKDAESNQSRERLFFGQLNGHMLIGVL